MNKVNEFNKTLEKYGFTRTKDETTVPGWECGTYTKTEALFCHVAEVSKEDSETLVYYNVYRADTPEILKEIAAKPRLVFDEGNAKNNHFRDGVTDAIPAQDAYGRCGWDMEFYEVKKLEQFLSNRE